MRVAAATSSLVLALSACSGGKQDNRAAPEKPAWSFDRTYNQGTPVCLSLRLDRTEISLSDKIVLEEELRVEEGFEAEFPEYLPEDFEGFSVVEITSSPTPGELPGAGSSDVPAPKEPVTPRAPEESSPAGSPGVLVRKKRLTLEPDRSGTLAIAPLAVYFHRGGEKTEQSFLTEEIPVIVAGVGSVKDLKLEPLRGIYEAPPDARPSRLSLYITAGALALAAGGATFFFLRRGPLRPPPPTPPHELAYEALRRLVALALIEKGEIELFFVHLSNILREYIERRFLVNAPERTTEEFLAEASRSEALAAHRVRLGQFLALCDQVKFARFEPDEAAIQGAFDLVKQFLAETTPVEAAAA